MNKAFVLLIELLFGLVCNTAFTILLCIGLVEFRLHYPLLSSNNII